MNSLGEPTRGIDHSREISWGTNKGNSSPCHFIIIQMEPVLKKPKYDEVIDLRDLPTNDELKAEICALEGEKKELTRIIHMQGLVIPSVVEIYCLDSESDFLEKVIKTKKTQILSLQLYIAILESDEPRLVQVLLEGANDLNTFDGDSCRNFILRRFPNVYHLVECARLQRMIVEVEDGLQFVLSCAVFMPKDKEEVNPFVWTTQMTCATPPRIQLPPLSSFNLLESPFPLLSPPHPWSSLLAPSLSLQDKLDDEALDDEALHDEALNFSKILDFEKVFGEIVCPMLFSFNRE